MAKKIYSVAIQQKYWLEDEELHFYKLNQHWLFDIQLVVCQGETRAMSLEKGGWGKQAGNILGKKPNRRKKPQIQPKTLM